MRVEVYVARGKTKGGDLNPPQRALDYAAGPRRRSAARWRPIARGLLKYVALALVAAVPAAAVYVPHRWPWIWYGSPGKFELHRMRTLRMPPEQVVFEEEPRRAAALLLRAPDAAMRSSSPDDGNWLSDYKRARGILPEVIFSPEFFRPQPYVPWDNALVFMHARTGPTGIRRAVWVEANRQRHTGGTPGVNVRVSWHECDWPFFRSDSGRRCMFRGITLRAAPDARVRLFAGQPDEDDAARFTIRYEIDAIPGTIEGRLGVDGTATMRVLEGPAATTQPVSIWGPGHPN
jgi:hypothetical protein